MVGALTVLWSELEKNELDLVKLAVKEHDSAVAEGVFVRRVVATSQSRALRAARDEGAVVLIATSGREASTGLSLGVDEVLRAGELTLDDLNAAIRRALARASGRAEREARVRARDARTFTLLAAALGNELGASLSIASTCCEVLSAGLPTRLSASDELLHWAVAQAPGERTRQLVAVCSSAPTAGELRGTADHAKDSVARALSIVKTLRELSFDGGQHVVAVDPLLRELVEMLRTYVRAWASLRLEPASDAVADMSRSNLTWIMATLIASALETIRTSKLTDAAISVRSHQADGCVVVEVEHDGCSPPDATPDELVSLREQTRHIGGELLIDQRDGATTLRLMIAAVDEPLSEHTPRRAAGWDHANDLES